MKALNSFCKTVGFFFFPFAYENKFSMRSDEKEKAPSTVVEGAFIRVTPFGFEPKTYCLEGSCSIQLSYGANYF
jgi:hypothetical protein